MPLLCTKGTMRIVTSTNKGPAGTGNNNIEGSRVRLELHARPASFAASHFLIAGRCGFGVVSSFE